MYFLKRYERHAAADKHIGAAREMAMADTAIQAALGLEMYAGLLRFSENYYVPNLDGKMFVPSPDMWARGASPVIPLQYSERYRLSPHFACFSLAQRTLISTGTATPELVEPSRYIARWETKLYYDACAQNELVDPGKMSLKKMGIIAMVSSSRVSWPHGSRKDWYILESQPVLSFAAEADPRSGLLFHEYVHHWQTSQQPVRRKPEQYNPQREYLGYEREAYSTEAKILAAMREQSDSKRLSRYHSTTLKVVKIIDDILSDPDCKDLIDTMDKRLQEVVSEFSAEH